MYSSWFLVSYILIVCFVFALHVLSKYGCSWTKCKSYRGVKKSCLQEFGYQLWGKSLRLKNKSTAMLPALVAVLWHSALS